MAGASLLEPPRKGKTTDSDAAKQIVQEQIVQERPALGTFHPERVR